MCVYCDIMTTAQPERGYTSEIGMDMLCWWRDGRKYTYVFADSGVEYSSFARVVFDPKEKYLPGACTIVAECVTDDYLGLPHLIKVYWDGSKLYTDVDEESFEESAATTVMGAIESRLL